MKDIFYFQDIQETRFLLFYLLNLLIYIYIYIYISNHSSLHPIRYCTSPKLGDRDWLKKMRETPETKPCFIIILPMHWHKLEVCLICIIFRHSYNIRLLVIFWPKYVVYEYSFNIFNIYIYKGIYNT